MKEQDIFFGDIGYREIDKYINKNEISSIMLVCGNSIKLLDMNKYFQKLQCSNGIKVVRFSEFSPNPLYESVVEGVELLKAEKCELIIVVGGGSAMDVAKCIKIFSNMSPEINYLEQTVIPNDVKLIAIPTTAGTGSEATRFAVIYYKGEKKSVSDESCIPDLVILDASVLKTLPMYQRKSTMLDAMCHALESYWSVNSTKESKEYSKTALKMILNNKDSYLANEEQGNSNMLLAANIAGRAINITQTTAGHALCYKLTGKYGIAHGHAAALCVRALWPYMVGHLDDCLEPRESSYLNQLFQEMAENMECKDINEAIEVYNVFLDSLELGAPRVKNDEDYEELVNSVNVERLKNNPIKLDKKAIRRLYYEILGH